MAQLAGQRDLLLLWSDLLPAPGTADVVFDRGAQDSDRAGDAYPLELRQGRPLLTDRGARLPHRGPAVPPRQVRGERQLVPLRGRQLCRLARSETEANQGRDRKSVV